MFKFLFVALIFILSVVWWSKIEFIIDFSNHLLTVVLYKIEEIEFLLLETQ
jgi:hypothetical protein